MHRILSTHLFASHRLTTALLDRLARAGVPAVEILCARQHLDYQNRAQAAELAHWFRESPMKLHSLHAPVFSDDVNGRSGPNAIVNITEPVKGRRLQMIDEIKRTLDLAEAIPFRYLVQHVGAPGQEYSERSVDAAFSSLEEISLFAKARGVEVLLENTPNGLATSERLLIFLEQTHLQLNFCFDVGHAHLSESVPTAFSAMKTRVKLVHLHDNDGKSDQHAPPFSRSIDWPAAMKLLKTLPGETGAVLEVQESAEWPNPLDEALRVFDKLEEIA